MEGGGKAVKDFSKKRLRQRQAYEARRGVRGRKRVVNAVVENEGEDEGQRNLALIREWIPFYWCGQGRS